MPALASIMLSDVRVEGRNPQIKPYQEAASQSFKAGQLLLVNSSGQVAIFAADGSNFDSTGDRIIGVAQDDATGTQGSTIRVRVLRNSDLVRMPVFHGTPASALTNANQIGDPFVLRNVGGVPMINIQTNTNPTGTIIAHDEQYAIGEAYGFVNVNITHKVMV